MAARRHSLVWILAVTIVAGPLLASAARTSVQLDAAFFTQQGRPVRKQIESPPSAPLTLIEDQKGPDALISTPQHVHQAPAEAGQVNSRGSAGKPVAGKQKLWPLDGIDVALLAIIMFSLSLAGGAGIGGGAILVPVYLMLRGWPTATAVALSNVTILGGSFANFICNVTRHRPNGRRTIDWELILMMEPTTIAGALVGAVANKILPNWITTYLLALVLTLMALRLYTKGKQTYRKETQLLAAAKAAAKEARREQRALLGSSASATGATGVNRQQQQGADGLQVAASGVVAVPAGRQVSQSAAGSTLSFSRSLSRSFSRLRGGSLVVGLEPGSSLTSPAGVITSGGLLLSAPATRDSSGGGAGTDDVANGSQRSRRRQDQALPAPVIEEYLRGTLFQGEAGDDAGPVVALTPTDDLSPESSAASEDLEAGDVDADHTDIRRPLLPKSRGAASSDDDLLQHHDQQADRAAAAADGPADKQWDQQQSSQQSTDLTVYLGPVDGTPKPPVRESSLPLPHFMTLLGLSAWVVCADIAQDSFRCGSWQYWASQLSVLVPVFVILGACRHVLLRKYNHDALPAGAQPADGELHWTRKTTIIYPLLCTTAGLIAGLFGIGGGVVKGPLMLELGVPADVAAATSATMIMFTAGSACLVYSRFGQILYDYALALMLLGFGITLCSQLLTFLLIKLLGRRSIIVFMMVALMAAATVIMYVQSGLVTADLVHHPEDLWKFGSVCPALKHPLKQLGQALLARLQ